MRRRLCLPACLAIAAIAGSGANAAIEPGPRLILAVELPATGDDRLTACQDGPFGEGAVNFGDSIAASLGLPRAEIEGDEQSDCIRVVVPGPITVRGPSGERVLRIDARALGSLAQQSGYEEAFLIVCTPRVTTRVDVATGPPPAEPEGCPGNGYAWSIIDPLDVEIAFRATRSDLFRGILASASWWIALATLAGLAGAAATRTTYRVPAAVVALAAAPLAALSALGWAILVIESGFVDVLQIRADLGPGGSLVVRSIGAALAVGVVALSARHVARGPRPDTPLPPAEPLPGSAGVPALPLRDSIFAYSLAVPRAGNALLWTILPGTSLVVAYLIFMATPASVEIKVEGMLAATIAYLLVVPALTYAALPVVYGASRLSGAHESRIVDALRATGSRVREIWTASLPPAAAPVGAAALIVGRRAFVWDRLAALAPNELAGAIAYRGIRRRSWIVPLCGAMAVVLLYGLGASGGRVPVWVIAGAVGVILAVALTDSIERIRIRTADIDAAGAETALRGLLLAGRAHARLAASGAIGILGAPLPGYGQAHWERTLRIARKLGAEAGIGDVAVARIADQVVALDARRDAGPPSAEPPPPVTAEPVTPTPAEPSEPARKTPAGKTWKAPARSGAKRKAPARKAAARKAPARKAPARRRAPAPRDRRSRP